MDMQTVRDRLSIIEGLRDDYEGAHAEEQQLYQDVLEHIAKGGSNGQALVQEALKAQRIKFPRYTA